MRLLGSQLSQRLDKRVKIQLAIFTVISTVAASLMIFGYIRVPSMMGVGRYTVTVQLPRSGGLYASGNVTYRGTEVGRVTDVRITDAGVDAVLSLRSDVHIPSDLDAQVHSVSGVGEQYVALLPRNGHAAPLKNGDVIPVTRTSVPPEINALLDAASRGIQAIPQDNLKTAIDESYAAVGGLGPDISRIVKGSTQLSIDARANLDPLVALIDKSKPVLESQADTATAIRGWAAHLADLTHQLQANDSSVAGLLTQGAAAADKARQLIDRLQPTLPVLLANLVSVGQVAIAYQPAIEQVLVLLPELVADVQGSLLANRDSKRPFPGIYVSFNLNLNLPPACTTGFLPAQQQRTPNLVETPPRPDGDLYCRIPQDSMNVVRGARNYPCLTRPGKRAPSVKMCESDEQYVPLNDGNFWKGDPNATMTGQDIPQMPPGSPPAQAPTTPAAPQQMPQAPPPIAAVEYDPLTGTYTGPDGHVYTRSDLAQNTKGKTWQSMLAPPSH